MSELLILFPTPGDGTCVAKDDHGHSYPSVPTTHPTGRVGIGIDMTAGGFLNGNGIMLEFTWPGKPTLVQRGTLWLKSSTPGFPWTPGQTAAFVADDFTAPAGVSLPPLRIQGTAFGQDL